MYYAPHKLYKLLRSKKRDRYGRVTDYTNPEAWELIANCRCDKNTDREIVTDNGKCFRPDFHVVCDLCKVLAGDTVKILGEDGNIIGGGKVYKSRHTNCYQYTELWV